MRYAACMSGSLLNTFDTASASVWLPQLFMVVVAGFLL